MAVNPNPTAPKPTKGKSSKGYSTADLRNYLMLGGNLTDLAGNKITQGQVLSAMSDPATLQLILSSLQQQYGGGGAYDPNKTYTTEMPTFEAQYNPVREKYASLTGVDAQIANDYFDSISSGTDPDVAAANLLDKNFIKTNYGVDVSKISNLAGRLTADGKKFQTAEQNKKTAVEKQNYDAWRKSVVDKGANFSEYLSKALGVPALANMPDPSQAYGATENDIAAKRALLTKINPAWERNYDPSGGPESWRSKYKPTKAEIAAAKKYASKLKSAEGRPDDIATEINRVFGVGEYAGTRQYIPESIFGVKQLGARATNELIGGTLAMIPKLGGFLGTGGGFNPFQTTASKEDLAKADAKVQKEAYDKYIANTTGAALQNVENARRERVLRLAAQKITERGQALQAKGITPFTQQLPSIQAILGGTTLPIVKN